MAKGRYAVRESIEGVILGVRSIQGKGRVQIPKVVRERLGLNEGDSVYFIESDGRIYIMKAVKIA